MLFKICLHLASVFQDVLITKNIKKLSVVFLFFVINANFFGAASFAAEINSEPKYNFSNGYSQIADDILPAVVTITATKIVKPTQQDIQKLQQFDELFSLFGIPHQNLFSNKESKSIILGSGFFISAEGYIITNHHVVNGASEIEIKNFEDKTTTAKVIASDKQTDIAILQVEDAKFTTKIAQFDDSSLAKVGDLTFVVGNPFGLGSSLTTGIVSARGRNISTSPYSDYIQTDAAINKGNSGGPVFNTNGKVIGISTAIYTPSGGNVGIGFAIPSNTAKDVVEKLMRDKKIVRSWLGVGIGEVSDDIAQSTKYLSRKGSFVLKVYEKSPASKAGIKDMDIICDVDGVEIISYNNLPLIVSNSKVGKKINLGVWRFGKKLQIPVILEQLKDDQTEQDQQQTTTIITKAEQFATIAGITVSSTKDGNGVIVQDVANNSPSSSSGIKYGHIILQVNSKNISNADDFIKEVQLSIEEKGSNKKTKKTALFKIKEGEESFIISVQLV